MNETTPLLANGTTSNRHRPLIRSSTTFEGQTLLPGNGVIQNFDAKYEDHSLQRIFQQETEGAVQMKEVVQALCSAWRQNRKPKTEITLDFFTTQELYAMHLAWVKVTRGRHCCYAGHNIAETLAWEMATVINPKSPFPKWHLSFISWNLAFHADKNLLSVNLLREWRRITEGDESFDRESFTVLDDSYRILNESEEILGFWQRQAQLCDDVRHFILQPRFQIPLHTLLFIWPVSIEIIATKYMVCPLSYHLLYLLMILGGVGCLAVFIRLVLILLTKDADDPEDLSWGWTALRLIEFIFFIIFIVQVFYFFDINTPSEQEHDRCFRNFYDAVLRTNCVSIVLVLAYMFVYFKNIC